MYLKSRINDKAYIGSGDFCYDDSSVALVDKNLLQTVSREKPLNRGHNIMPPYSIRNKEMVGRVPELTGYDSKTMAQTKCRDEVLRILTVPWEGHTCVCASSDMMQDFKSKLV